MRNMELLAAGIVRDILFRSADHLDLYLYALDHKKHDYVILDKRNRSDGSVIIRIVTQYNYNELIQL